MSVRSADVSAPVPISPLRGAQQFFFLLGLVLLWPSAVFGDVFAFNDTVSYLRAADTLSVKLSGQHHPFFAAPLQAAGTDHLAEFNSAKPDEASETSQGMVLFGRSIYFGMFLYSGLMAGSMLLIAIAHALATGAVIVALVRHFVDPADQKAFAGACAITFALAACSPLPFFVCFLMPDLVVGLALPAMALLLVGWGRERLVWRYFLFGLCAFAALSHSTAVALLLVFGAGALLIAWKMREALIAIPAALVLLAGLGGVAGEGVFGAATRIMTGSSPVRPPFLTARLIEDGPARLYLANLCDRSSPFTLCRYPVWGDVTAETFLWDPKRPSGGFKALPVADAVKVSNEQFRFAIAVASAYPLETVSGLTRGIFSLLGSFSLEEFRPEFLARRMDAHTLFETVNPTVPIPPILRLTSILTCIMLASALVAVPFILRANLPRHHKVLVLTIFAGLIVNDAICASFSGPFARYNTRGVWAPILVVLLAALSVWGSRWGFPITCSKDTSQSECRRS